MSAQGTTRTFLNVRFLAPHKGRGDARTEVTEGTQPLQITHRRASYGLALTGQGGIFPLRADRELHDALGDLAQRRKLIDARRHHLSHCCWLPARAGCSRVPGAHRRHR
jgi:hypothetical protein